MSQNVYLTTSSFNYWLNSSHYYGIFDKNKFVDLFLPFCNVNQVSEYNENAINNIVIHDIQSDGIINSKNINIMLCVENCKFWKHYNHINKYGDFGNDKISIYIYNHINKLITTRYYIAIPVIYLQIDYYQKYHNSIQPNILTSFDKKQFCLIVSFDKKQQNNNDINSLIDKVQKIGRCDSIKNIKNIKNSSCYHSLDLLNIFNRYKFIICFENSWCNGYITEKPFNAVFARTIPIYGGSPDVNYYFNNDRFIDIRQDHTSIINKIISLTQNEKIYNDYINSSFINKDFDNENYIEKTNNFITHLRSENATL